jgi:hypothetical protein
MHRLTFMPAVKPLRSALSNDLGTSAATYPESSSASSASNADVVLRIAESFAWMSASGSAEELALRA